MSHFDFLNNGAEPNKSDSSLRRRRRQLRVVRQKSRKLLDQYLLEKMESRWLPTVVVTQPTASSLLITLDSTNDSVLFRRTGGSGVDNVNITATNSLANSSFSGITSITINDITGVSNQTAVFQDGSTGNFVSTISANSIEFINISTRLNGSLTVTGGGSEIQGSVSGSFSNQIVANNSTLTVVSPQLTIQSLSSNDSTLNLAVAFSIPTVSATDSCVSVANTIAPDFSSTDLVLTGGSLSVIQDSNLKSLTMNAGAANPVANIANSANLVSITQNSGTLTFEGNVQNLTVNSGTLTIRRTPGTVIGVVDNPKVLNQFQVLGGTVSVQDDANIASTTTVNGTTTSLTVQSGANYTPTIASVNVNNGTVNISNTTMISGSSMTVSNGNVTLTNNTFSGDVSIMDGSLSVTDGRYYGGFGIVGGSLEINGALLMNNLNISSPVLTINGGSVSVLNSTVDASANSNAVEVGSLFSSLVLGNATQPGNNTFNISAGGNPYFIRNGSIQPIYALGNIWNYNGTSLNTTSDAFDIANYLFSAPNGKGAVYFNGSNIYVLNNQQGLGVTSISDSVLAAAPGDTVYVQAGSNVYNETIDIRKSLDLIGVSNGTAFPLVQLSGACATFGYYVRLFEVESDPQINTISNITFDGSLLNAIEANTTRVIDQQFYANSSSTLNLSGDVVFSGFNPYTNNEMILISGGSLNLSTTNVLESSILISTSGIDVTFDINSGTTVNGTLSITPSADPVNVNILGTLNGNSSSSLNLQYGTVNISGTITGSPVAIDGATVNVSNGTITSDVSIQSGILNISGSSTSVSGSLSILGGSTAITAGTFSADTSATPSSVNGVISISGGQSTVSGVTVLANNNGTTYRDGILIDGSSAGFAGTDVTLSNLTITMGSTNTQSTAGIRMLGVDSVLDLAAQSNVTFGDSISVQGGNYSLSIAGVNSNIVGNVLGNISLDNPLTGYIQLSDSALYNDQTNVITNLDASHVTFLGGSLPSGTGYQPSTVPFQTSALPYLFEIESKIFDYTTGANLGFVTLYSTERFAINGRLIQNVINPSSSGDSIYVQSGTYSESLVIDSTKTGLSLLGPVFYGNSTAAQILPPDGSVSAILVESNDVQIKGLTLAGANGSTDLLSNGNLSGTNYGVTNFNGTIFTPISNLTVADNYLAQFINAGVYLSNNTACAPSHVANNAFAAIGIDGYFGGVVLENDSYVGISNNVMTGVTNGVVIRNFSASRSSGSSDIINNNISAFSTGLTLSNHSAAVSSFTVGSGANRNIFQLASGMNSTIPGPLSNETIGMFLQGLSGSNVPTVADNNITGFAFGIDITDVAQPLTISGGTISNASRTGFAVLKNQSFDPNGSAPGVGASNLTVFANGVTIHPVSSSTGFEVDANLIAGGASLTLDAGSTVEVGTASTFIGAQAVNHAELNVKSAVFNDMTSHSGQIGILNSNSIVNVMDSANISGFAVGLSQSLGDSQTTISGGLINSDFSTSQGISLTGGCLTITGGVIQAAGSGVSVNSASSDIVIDSNTANTQISSSASAALEITSANLVSIAQSASNSTNLTSAGAEVVTFSGAGSLNLSGGSIETSNISGNGVLFGSTGLMTVTGGTLQGNSSGNGTGIEVTSGNLNITGGTVDSGFAKGIRFGSSSGLLTIGGNATVPSISGSDYGLQVAQGSANLSGGRVSSNQTGLLFESTGNLTVLPNSLSNITGTNGNGILVTNGTAEISGGVISGSAIGINFNGSQANGSVSDVNFVGGSSDLQLNQTGYAVGGGVTLGNNLSFTGSSNHIGYVLNQSGQSYLLSNTTTFSGVALSSLSVPSNLSSYFAIQNRIVDELDVAGYGLVKLTATNLFVTPQTYYSPVTSNTSIQRAVNAASLNDSIYVQNGTYVPEDVTVNKTVSVLGGGSSGTILSGANWTIDSPSILVDGFHFSGLGSAVAINPRTISAQPSSLTLSNLIVSNYVAGVVASGATTDVSNLQIVSSSFQDLITGVEVSANVLTSGTFESLTFSNVSGTSIDLIRRTSGNLTIANSSFNGLGSGIKVRDLQTSSVQVQNSTFLNNANGVEVLSSSSNLILNEVTMNNSGNGLFVSADGSLDGVQITQSTISNGTNGVLVLSNSTITTNESRLTNVELSDLTFSQQSSWGLNLASLNNATISNVTVVNNGGTSLNSGGLRIALSNGTFTNLSVSNSSILENGLGGNSTNPGIGIQIISDSSAAVSGVSLTNLTISGNGTSSSSLVGIHLGGNLSLATTSLTNLTIQGSNSTGLVLQGSTNGSFLNLNNLTFASTLDTYIRNESGGSTIDGTNATFGGLSAGAGLGVDDAYTISDKIEDGVDTTGWGFVLLKSGNIYVTPNSFVSPSTSPSIQRAIDLSSTHDQLWIQGNTGAANYTGGANTTGRTLVMQSGNETVPSIVNLDGDFLLSSTTIIPVRVGGTTDGSYTQFNVNNLTQPIDFANAEIQYSNISTFIPSVGDQFKIINQIPAGNVTSSRLTANISGALTVLQDETRYELASGQYFATLYQGITGTDRNDFVLVSVPQYVSNVVVYESWSSNYFGDPVSYVDASGTTQQLTYGVSAASNITTAINQIQAPVGTSATLSLANGTYVQTLGGYTSNLAINVIGANATSIPDARIYGNVTVGSIALNQNTTINYRVLGATGSTTYDRLNTNGSIALSNATANISFNGSFNNPGLIKSDYLTLIDNTNSTTNPISGEFLDPTGNLIATGDFYTVPGNTTDGFYTTYKLGTAVPYNDFALIWNTAQGSITDVQVDQTWATSNLDFGAIVTVGSSNYTIGIDAFGEMKSYQPASGTVLSGAVNAISPNGTITIAAGNYNSTFTVDKGFALTGPSSGDASFPAATGQTVLAQNGSDAANVTLTHWTGNLLFGDLLVNNGTIFDNVAHLIDDGGTLSFQSGITFNNVSLSASRSMTITSDVPGSVTTLTTGSVGAGVSATGSNVNLTLNNLVIDGTNTGFNFTNTGSIVLGNVILRSSLSSAGSLNGPTSLTLNYASDNSNQNLTLTQSELSFTPFGSNNLSMSGLTGLNFNANLGSGNNTVVLAANSTVASGLIQTGSGVDAFTISAPQPLNIQAGGGNDTISLRSAGAYISSFDGESGTNTFRSGPNSVNYIDIDGDRTGAVYLNRGVTSTKSSFSNIDLLYGNAYTDIFSFTSSSSSISSINGGNGNDQLNFTGTSGANNSFAYSNQIEANITGSGTGLVNYFNFSNTTARVSVVDRFVSVENLKGGASDDIFRFGANGSISGSLSGESGNNTLDYSSYPTGIRVNLSNNLATAVGGGSAYRTTNIRDVFGSAFNDMLIGDSGNNILSGNAGNDSIIGNAGNDILVGGIGQDTLRGGTGSNIDIGGYLNFDTGGTSAGAYGIPSQYADFVLRSMMDTWVSAIDDATFTSAANTLESTGVSVQVPGNTTSYSNIRLFAANATSSPDPGTVFDDGQGDTIDMSSSTLNWIFIPQFGDVLIGTPKRVTYVYKLIP